VKLEIPNFFQFASIWERLSDFANSNPKKFAAGAAEGKSQNLNQELVAGRISKWGICSEKN